MANGEILGPGRPWRRRGVAGTRRLDAETRARIRWSSLREPERLTPSLGERSVAQLGRQGWGDAVGRPYERIGIGGTPGLVVYAIPGMSLLLLLVAVLYFVGVLRGGTFISVRQLLRRMPEFPCPSCGKPMEQGYLVTESIVGGAKWMEEKTRLAIGGEPLQPPDRWGNVYLAGLRCATCRLLALRY